MNILEIWLAGEKLPTSTEILGVQLLWWVRFAKIVQLFAVLFLVVEFFGIKRITEFALNINERVYRVRGRVEGVKRIVVGAYPALKSTIFGSIDDHHSLSEEKKFRDTSIAQIIVSIWLLQIVLLLWLVFFSQCDHCVSTRAWIRSVLELESWLVRIVVIVASLICFIALLLVFFLSMLGFAFLLLFTLSGMLTVVGTFLGALSVALRVFFNSRAFRILEALAVIGAVLSFFPELLSA